MFAGETETSAEMDTPAVKPEDAEPVERIEPFVMPDAIQEVEIAETLQEVITDNPSNVSQQLDNRIRCLQEIMETEGFFQPQKRIDLDNTAGLQKLQQPDSEALQRFNVDNDTSNDGNSENVR